MKAEILAFNQDRESGEKEICDKLAEMIVAFLPEAEYKIWHGHPVWFLEDNPIVGYSKLKAGIQLMFWSGTSFEEDQLKSGSGKFKDASIMYTDLRDLNEEDIRRWL